MFTTNFRFKMFVQLLMWQFFTSTVPVNSFANRVPDFIEVYRKTFPDLMYHHKYYNSTLYKASLTVSDWWNSFDVNKIDKDSIVNQGELDADFKVLNLSFRFPFYGEQISSVGISTKGYITTSPLLAAEFDTVDQIEPHTAHIAPLMANFVAPTKRNAKVDYLEFKIGPNKHLLVVRWINVIVKGQKSLGNYSFMVIIEQGGKITFLYKELPVHPFNFVDSEHPVTIGLADAYAQSITPEETSDILFCYHSANLKQSRGQNITSNTVIVWTPEPTCSVFTNCEDCKASVGVADTCFWCPTLSICGAGFGRNRPQWEKAGCHQIPLGSCEAKPFEDSDNNEMWSKNAIHLNHTYYNVSIHPGEDGEYFKFMKNNSGVVIANNLKNQSRGSVSIKLNFEFPFYEQGFTRFYLTSEGFVSFSRILHPYIHVSQFIAPLRADFVLQSTSTVRYLNQNDSMTVEWENLFLENDPSLGPFTFQCQLLPSGEIVFGYEKIPVKIDPEFSVKHGVHKEDHGRVLSGLSDAFIWDHNLFEYDQVSVNLSAIQDATLVRFVPKPSCNSYQDCHSCLSGHLDVACSWCPTFEKCFHSENQLLTNGSHCYQTNFHQKELCSQFSKRVLEEFPEQFYNITIALDEDLVEDLWILPDAGLVLDRALDLDFSWKFYGESREVLTILPKFGTISLVSNMPQAVPLQGSYITPLLSIFDVKTQPGPDDGIVKYFKNESHLVVKWDNVPCSTSYMDRNRFDQRFSFLISLNSTGEITFAYRKVPVSIRSTSIPFDSSVRIGLSYSMSENLDLEPFLFHLAILPAVYRHHSLIDLSSKIDLIRNNTIIRFTPVVPTCFQFSSCESCVSSSDDCGWCSGSRSCNPNSRKFICGTEFVSKAGKLTNCNAASLPPKTPPSERKPTPTNETHLFYKSFLSRNQFSFNQYLGTNTDEVVAKMNYPKEKKIEATLGFDFPFYGHPVRKVVVMLEGYLALPSIMHANLKETQYVAPLMAKFDINPLIMTSSVNILVSNSSHFIVDWRDVYVSDMSHLGIYTFGLILKSSGDIIFIYDKVPAQPINFGDTFHPVMFGLSDAYHMEQMSGHSVSYKMVTYHKLDLSKHFNGIIGTGAVISLHAMPTCAQFKTCLECLTGTTSFQCAWCPAIKRCSNTIKGLDRGFQEWNNELCSEKKNTLMDYRECPIEMVRSKHPFYNVTVHHNSREAISFARIPPSKIHRADGKFVLADLPFEFYFYEMPFRQLNISAYDGFASLEGGPENVTAQIDICRNLKFESPTDGETVVKNYTMLYGAPSTDSFVVRWNKFYELTLFGSGAIVFKYAEVPNAEEATRVVGIGYTAGTDNGPIVYRIDKSPERHAKKGLVLRFEPLPSCRSLYSSCDECLNATNLDCAWCENRCQESFLSCHHPPMSCSDIHVSWQSKLESHHVAGIVGLLLLIVGLVCGGFVFYGLTSPQSRPGLVLERFRVTRYSRFHELVSIAEMEPVRRDSQATMISDVNI